MNLIKERYEGQINCLIRGSDEGQWGSPGERASLPKIMNQTGKSF